MEQVIAVLDERLANPGDTLPVAGHLDEPSYSLGNHDFTLPQGIDYDLMLTNAGEGILATGILRAHVEGVCDRCLDPMPIEINDEQEIFSEDEPNDQMVNGQMIDLSWLAYEIVSINIPIVHSHQPGECNQQMELLLHDHLCDEPEPEEN